MAESEKEVDTGMAMGGDGDRGSVGGAENEHCQVWRKQVVVGGS